MSEQISDSLDEQSGAAKGANKIATDRLKSAAKTKIAARTSKIAAGSALGPAGTAVAVVVEIATSPFLRKLALCLAMFIIIMCATVQSLPSVVFNSIFHTNEFNNAEPTLPDQIQKEMYDKNVVYTQEAAVITVVRSVLDEAYQDALLGINSECVSMSVEADRSRAHIIDNTVGKAQSPVTDADPDIDEGASSTVFNDEYSFVALISAYSLSIDQMKPETGENGLHIGQDFELDKNCSTDITKKLRAFYQGTRTTHGNKIYQITYAGESENGKPTIYDDQEKTKGSDGSTHITHHYYIIPIINDIDIKSVCSGSFGLNFNAPYEKNSNYTVADAVSSMSTAHLAMLYDITDSSSTDSGGFVSGSLTEAEINQVMKWVDAQYPNLPAARRAVIHIGLQSVGLIPYYLGGHADDGPYICRRWGTIVNGQPYGLDCGSFVGWVYGAANVTDAYMCNGRNCSNHWSTSRYASVAKPISESELLPGDITLLTPADARTLNPNANHGHIGIYVCKDASGNRLILHCCGHLGAVLHRYKQIDTTKGELALYKWERLPLDYVKISKTNTFPQKLTYKNGSQEIFDGLKSLIN